MAHCWEMLFESTNRESNLPLMWCPVAETSHVHDIMCHDSKAHSLVVPRINSIKPSLSCLFQSFHTFFFKKLFMFSHIKRNNSWTLFIQVKNAMPDSYLFATLSVKPIFYFVNCALGSSSS